MLYKNNVFYINKKGTGPTMQKNSMQKDSMQKDSMQKDSLQIEPLQEQSLWMESLQMQRKDWNVQEEGVRIEKDMLGEMPIPANSYAGIHTFRAVMNFPLSKRRLHPELIRAYAEVKKAAALANMKCKLLELDKGNAIVAACDMVIQAYLQGGKTKAMQNSDYSSYDEKVLQSFLVDPLCGGAGTSINMNVNEVIANLALEYLGKPKGDYHALHPLNDVNLSQSTNDTFPTAVRIAAIRLLGPLSERFAKLQTALQEKEEAFASILKVGRTELNDAVPITVGQEFGSWARATERDRWRLYKAQERLRQINLGGTAVGTGLNASTRYIFHVTDFIREITGLGLARTEYMMDATQNMDVFVEVAGLLKTAAVNLGKIAADLRLLASGPDAGIGELSLPKKQVGSTIMPGKVNPVICEAVNQVVYRVIGLESVITNAALGGQLELNAFLPVISDSLFEMLDLMANTVSMFTEECICGIEVNRGRCQELVDNSMVKLPAFLHVLGYEQVTRLAKRCQEERKSIEEVLMEEELLTEEEIHKISNVLAMTTPGLPK